MKKYLLDTNAASDFIYDRRGVQQRARQERKRGAKIGTVFTVIAELYYGVELSETKKVNLERVDAGIRHFKIWPFDTPAAKEYGRIAAKLKQGGKLIQQNDMMIAAIALTIPDCILVTRDTDFNVLPGLTVENWAS
jgi:tRNA(fMet)-specific endonuclease VapC